MVCEWIGSPQTPKSEDAQVPDLKSSAVGLHICSFTPRFNHTGTPGADCTFPPCDLSTWLFLIFPHLLGRSAVQKLGAEVFDEVYTYLKRARQQRASEAEVRAALETVVPRASDCFEVDQLLYFEEQLLITRGEGATLQNHQEATTRDEQRSVDECL
uniref:Uncharacterized protein n=1 Tax=Catagonus wagneri TaxID=51154 RepID=A0A8C3YPH5_9CETA